MKKVFKAWKRMLSMPEGRKAALKYFGGTGLFLTGLMFILDGTTGLNAVSTANLIQDVMTPEELEDFGNRLADHVEKRDLD